MHTHNSPPSPLLRLPIEIQALALQMHLSGFDPSANYPSGLINYIRDAAAYRGTPSTERAAWMAGEIRRSVVDAEFEVRRGGRGGEGLEGLDGLREVGVGGSAFSERGEESEEEEKEEPVMLGRWLRE